MARALPKTLSLTTAFHVGLHLLKLRTRVHFTESMSIRSFRDMPCLACIYCLKLQYRIDSRARLMSCAAQLA